MVVSNRNVEQQAEAIGAWDRLVGILRQWLGTGSYGWLQTWKSRGPHVFGPRLPAHRRGSTIRRMVASQRQSQYLLERSALLFRRENQGESFDDDVSALRDQVGSGRRDQADDAQYSDDDPTTYSPPRQSWNTTSEPTATSHQAAAQQQPIRPAPEAGEASVIAADTVWDGSVQSNGSVHVYGTLGGNINAEGDVYVAEGASVAAEVSAGSVTVAGSIEGTIECTGRFEVLPTGRVSADVAAPRLVVHEGAVVTGKLRMTTDSSGV